MNRIKSLVFSYDNDKKPRRLSDVARYLWHENSHVEHLSILNCFVLQKSCFFLASKLPVNQYLTRLSILLRNLSLAVELMPYVPSLEHLYIRLYGRRLFERSEWAFKNDYCKSQIWPLGVKSLRIVAYNYLMIMSYFYQFVRRFSSTLEHLSLYFTTQSSYFLASHQNFERCLLRRLPYIKRLEFSINTGLYDEYESDGGHTFDNWKRQLHVISIFNSKFGQHTRFTYPYMFDSLEYVSNDLLNFHSNQYRSDFVLLLPSVVNISFYSVEKLSLALFTFIYKVFPHLRRMTFDNLGGLTDDFIQDVQLIFPTIAKLYFSELSFNSNQNILLRLLRLAPNIKHLIVYENFIHTIVCAKDEIKLLKSIDRITVTNCSSQAILGENNLNEHFPNINISYEIKI
jgi:hypothetical protein